MNEYPMPGRRLLWAPTVRLESGLYRDRPLAEVALADPDYVRARARHPDPSWSHSLAVALRLIARELERAGA
jgi:hypothetical protein